MSRPKLGLFHCGKCRQRYLFNHLCVTTKARGKTRLKPGLRFTCSGCKKEHGNPLTHRCEIKSDFRKRRATATRKAKTAARAERARQRKQLAAIKRKAAAAKRAERRKQRRAETAKRRRQAAARRREAARQRKKARAATPKPSPAPRHEPATCRDPECAKYGCVHFREGYEAGQLDCPYDHPGETP